MAQVEGTQIRFTSDFLNFRIYRGEFIEVKKSYTESFILGFMLRQLLGGTDELQHDMSAAQKVDFIIS